MGLEKSKKIQDFPGSVGTLETFGSVLLFAETSGRWSGESDSTVSASAAVAAAARQRSLWVQVWEAAKRPHRKHVTVCLVVDSTRLVKHAHHVLLHTRDKQ